MASESSPPPQPSGSGARYAIVGVVLFAVAGLAYCLTQPGEEPTTTAHPTTPVTVDAGTARSTALVDDTLEIPDLPPDTGLSDAGQPTGERTTGTGERRPVSPSGGSWDCAGEVDQAAARAVIAENTPQIRSCYERRLKQNAVLQGSMSLQVRVAADGHVDAVQVGGSLRDREVFSCVRGIANRMRFSRVTGGSCSVIAVPFTFTPQH